MSIENQIRLMAKSGYNVQIHFNGHKFTCLLWTSKFKRPPTGTGDTIEEALDAATADLNTMKREGVWNTP